MNEPLDSEEARALLESQAEQNPSDMSLRPRPGETPEDVLERVTAAARLKAVPDPTNDWDDWAMPIDYAIVAALPPQGSRLGYHVLGSTVKTILETLNAGLPKEAHMTPGIVAQRITRWLRPQGMVVEVKVHGSGGSKGYQVTDRGQQMAESAPKEES
jgi:hypothetical protein